MYLSILIFPFLGSLLSGLFGHRLGYKGSEYLIQLSIFISFVFCLIGLYEIVYSGNELSIKLFKWLSFNLLDSDIGFKVDCLGILMACLVTCITGLVVFYSGEYMVNDKSYIRYISYIGLFSFFMLIVILSDNLLFLFLGWEGVGLVSYLLVSFWTTSLEGNKSAIQAVLVNRIGDICLLVGICCLYFVSGSLSYSIVFSVIGENSNLLLISGLLVIVAGMSKSAQLGLHTWLPNAMSAPTPISALLHAATMVTAGVYLFVRLSILLESSILLLNILVVVGSIGLFVTGSIALVMNDIKKIIAYSTGSQLGYMVLACGLSSYKLAIYHLLNHGFFKALLFLSAGIVIHGLGDEQDLRRMGGLRKVMPLAYAGFVIGSIALLGLPFLSGFYSKDSILELALVKSLNGSLCSSFGYILALIGAFLTAFYSIRLLCLVFIVKVSGSRSILSNSSEGGLRMTLPLVVLIIMTIFIGYLSKDMLIGFGNNVWSNCIVVGIDNERLIDSEFMFPLFKLLPVIVSLLGLLLSFYVYVLNDSILYVSKVSSYLINVYRFLSMRWLFDKIYNELILQENLRISYNMTYKVIDKGLLELFGSRGLGFILLFLGYNQSKFQTGNIYNYSFIIITFALFNIILVLG